MATDALKIDGERLRSEGASVMHLAVDRQLAGIPCDRSHQGHHAGSH